MFSFNKSHCLNYKKWYCLVLKKHVTTVLYYWYVNLKKYFNCILNTICFLIISMHFILHIWIHLSEDCIFHKGSERFMTQKGYDKCRQDIILVWFVGAENNIWGLNRTCCEQLVSNLSVFSGPCKLVCNVPTTIIPSSLDFIEGNEHISAGHDFPIHHTTFLQHFVEVLPRHGVPVSSCFSICRKSKESFFQFWHSFCKSEWNMMSLEEDLKLYQKGKRATPLKR